MGLTRASFESKGFDEILYRKYYQQHQQSSIRRKLDFIYAYQSGKEVSNSHFE